MDGVQLALGLLGVSGYTGYRGTGQVDDAPLNQVEDDGDGAAEEGAGNNTGRTDQTPDELVVDLSELYDCQYDSLTAFSIWRR